MARLTKEQLTARGFRRKEIEIPGTAGTLLIRELSAMEARVFRDRLRSLGDADPLPLTAEIVAAGVIEDDGTPTFAADEIPTLPSILGGPTLDYIAAEIARLAGLLPGDQIDLEKKDAGN